MAEKKSVSIWTGTVFATVSATSTFLVLVFLVVASFVSEDARAADAERGRSLYENHCTVCHTSVVHVRDQRKAGSREEIRSWVLRWQKELNLQWEATEVNDVIEFLNKRYYKLQELS